MDKTFCVTDITESNMSVIGSTTGSLQLSHCGYLRCLSSHSFGPAIRNHLLIHYVVSGKGVYHRNGRPYPVGAGQVFIILPHELTYYEADAENPWEYYWVGVLGDSIDATLRQLGINQERLVLSLPAPSVTIVRWLSSMVECYTTTYDNVFRSLGYMNLFLGEIAAALPPTDGNTDQLVDKIARYIQENYAYVLSVESLCRHFNISRSHFSRLFKARLGISPQQFIMRTRVESAKLLLSETSLSVTDVAFSCGFQDTAHFSNTFKAYTSLSPTGYRSGRQSG